MELMLARNQAYAAIHRDRLAAKVHADFPAK